jgi:glyoxylase I family protein
MLQQFHHVAYRCNDAVETVEFYTQALGLSFSHALTNDVVPSVQTFCPHIHVFFELADRSCIAFFEVPTCRPATKDPHTPEWVQHLAFKVSSEEELLKGKERLERFKVDVLGPIDHDFALSIYFFDPSGHRLELTYDIERAGERERNQKDAYPILHQWQSRKTAEKWAPEMVK